MFSEIFWQETCFRRRSDLKPLLSFRSEPESSLHAEFHIYPHCFRGCECDPEFSSTPISIGFSARLARRPGQYDARILPSPRSPNHRRNRFPPLRNDARRRSYLCEHNIIIFTVCSRPPRTRDSRRVPRRLRFSPEVAAESQSIIFGG